MLFSAPLPYNSDATAFYAAIADLPWAVWLDSGGRDRYDVLVAQPAVTLVTRGEQTEISDADGIRHSSADPFSLLREQLDIPLEPIPGIKFAGEPWVIGVMILRDAYPICPARRRMLKACRKW